MSRTRTKASIKIPWRVENEEGFESPFGGRRESGGGGLGERGKERGEAFI